MPLPECADTYLGVVVYALALVWGFLGIAVISNVQMASIEVITASRRTIESHDKEGREIQVRMWPLWAWHLRRRLPRTQSAQQVSRFCNAHAA
jgi:hypothetical protein